MVCNFVAVCVSLLTTTVGAQLVAQTLEEWFRALQLNVETDYSDTFAGIRVRVDEMECEGFRLRFLDASFRPPYSLRVDFEELDASCQGKYKWDYSTGIGKVRGDGKVSARLQNSEIEFDLTVQLDKRGAPTLLRLETCIANMKLRDVDTQGDPLGNAANLFLDSFVPVFASDIEDLVCDTLVDLVKTDLSVLVAQAGLQACSDGGSSAQKAVVVIQDAVVAWQDTLENATGPGARIASALYQALDQPNAEWLTKAVLDVIDSFDVPLVSKKPLDLDGPYKVFGNVDRTLVDTSYSIIVGGTCITVTRMNEPVLLRLCVAGDDQTFTMRQVRNSSMYVLRASAIDGECLHVKDDKYVIVSPCSSSSTWRVSSGGFLLGSNFVNATSSPFRLCSTDSNTVHACPEDVALSDTARLGIGVGLSVGTDRALLVIDGLCLDADSMLGDCEILLADPGNASLYRQSTNFFWSVQRRGGQIVNDGTGRCLTYVDSTTLGTLPCDSTIYAQRWRITSDELVNFESGNCLISAQGSSCASVMIFEFFGDSEEKSSSLFNVFNAALANVSIVASKPLSDAGLVPTRLDARRLVDAARISVGFPDVNFKLAAFLQAAFAFDNLGDWLVQTMRAPVLGYQIGLNATISHLFAKALCAVSVSANRTRKGLDTFTVKETLDTNCFFSKVGPLDARLESLSVNYTRSRLSVVLSKFQEPGGSGDYYLERQIATNVVPEIVKLLDIGLSRFFDCAVNEYISTLGRETLTDFTRKVVGAKSTRPKIASQLEEQCHQTKMPKPQLLAFNESRLVRFGVRRSADFDAKSLAESIVEAAAKLTTQKVDGTDGKASFRFAHSVEANQDHLILIAPNGGKLLLSPLRTSFEVSDVFIANLDKALTNLTLFPGGTDALRSARRVHVLTARTLDSDIVFGATIRIGSPIGKAVIMVNLTFFDIEVTDVLLDIFLDLGALNSMIWGTHLGMSDFLTRDGDLTLPACLASTLEAVTMPEAPRIRIGSVGAAAWSDVRGLDSVVETGFWAAVSLVRDYVDSSNAWQEAMWLVNDAIDGQLSTARKTCLHLRPSAPVADRRDARGTRPSAVARGGAVGISGTDLVLTVDIIAIILCIAIMFFAFFLIRIRRNVRGASRSSLGRLIYSARTTISRIRQARRGPLEVRQTALHDDADDADVDEPSFKSKAAAPADTVNTAAAGKAVVMPHRALIENAPLPALCRYGLLVLMIGNTGLLVSSNVAIAAQARLRLELWLEDVGSRSIWVGTDSTFSLVESVGKLWAAGSIVLALLVALLSGAWPYIELAILIWGYTKRGIRPDLRERVWRGVEMLSKWSFIDVFIVVFLIVAFYVDVSVATIQSTAKVALFIEARFAFYAFLCATLISMCLGQIVLKLHRRVHRGQSRFHKNEDDTALPDITSNDDDDCAMPLAQGAHLPLCQHRLKGTAPRWWQMLVGPVVLCIGCLLAVSFTLNVVAFDVGGGAGLLVDITEGTSIRYFTAPGIAHALRASTPSDSWRPLVRFLEAVVLVFACVMPLAHAATLAALWLVPLSAPTQAKLQALSETAYGWSSLDVYLVSILATATQATKLADSLAKGPCETVNGYLEAFFRSALQGDTQCYRLAVKIRPGCVVLAFACCAQMVLGCLTAAVTNAAVAERIANAAIRPVSSGGPAPYKSSLDSKSQDHDSSSDDHLGIELAVRNELLPASQPIETNSDSRHFPIDDPSAASW